MFNCLTGFVLLLNMSIYSNLKIHIITHTLEKDHSPQCGFDGMMCLDRADLVFPQTTIMQPWRTNGLVCDCLPSCTEHEIRHIARTYK